MLWVLHVAIGLDYQSLPKRCNPCCSQSHPFNNNGVSRCGGGSCTSNSALDEVACAIGFGDDATLTNGNNGDAFVYYSGLETVRDGVDGHAYLDKTANRVSPTGSRTGYGHERWACNGLCANACSGTWGGMLIYLGSTYELASGNKIHTLGWGAGYARCGGFVDGGSEVSTQYPRNNHGETPNYDTYSLDACAGATWLLMEADGGCGGVSLSDGSLRVVIRSPPTPPPTPPLPPPRPPFAYDQLPKRCNPCCSSNTHPFNTKGLDRCGHGHCPAEASPLDEVSCAIQFSDDASLTNGFGSGIGDGTGDAFVVHTDLGYVRGRDGLAYLDKTVRVTQPTGHRVGYSHPRTPCTDGFCVNACTGHWGSLLVFLGSEYRLAAGNDVRLGGWAEGHMECGGHMSKDTHGADSAVRDYERNNYHEVRPPFATMLNTCLRSAASRARAHARLSCSCAGCPGCHVRSPLCLRSPTTTHTHSTCASAPPGC